MKKVLALVLLVVFVLFESAMAAGAVRATWDGEKQEVHEVLLQETPKESVQITVNLGEPIAFHSRFYIDCCEQKDYVTVAFRLSEEERVHVIYFLKSGVHTCVIDGVYTDVWVKPALEIYSVNGKEEVPVEDIRVIWE